MILLQCTHQEAVAKLLHAKVSSQHLAVSRLSLPSCNAAKCRRYRLMSACAAQMLHRLDLCTTGVLVLARTDVAAWQFTADITMHHIQKQYKVRAHTV